MRPPGPADDGGLAPVLEQLALQEDFEELGRRALEALAARTDPRQRATAAYYLGLSELRLAQPGQGLEHLRQAEREFGALGDELMVIRCMDLVAGALGVME